MKRKVSLLAVMLLISGIVLAVVPGTMVIGDATFVQSRLATTREAKVYSVSGYNSSNVTQFIMIFEGTNTPTNGQIPKFSIPVAATNFYSYDFSYYGADLYGVSACNSTTAQSNTLGSVSCSFQFIIAQQ